MKEHIKVKGVPKDVLEKCTQDDFIQVLDSGKPTTIRMQSIRSYQHQLYTVEMLKKGLSCNDVKRWICDDNINMQPYGYNPLTPEEEAAAEERRQQLLAEEEAENAHWKEFEEMEGTPIWRWED